MRLERKIDHICKYHVYTISTSCHVGNGQENGIVRMPVNGKGSRKGIRQQGNGGKAKIGKNIAKGRAGKRSQRKGKEWKGAGKQHVHTGMQGNNLESHAEPLPGSLPERQGKEHSKELCALRMPRAGQTTHTHIYIYNIYVSMRLMAIEENQKRHSKGLQ